MTLLEFLLARIAEDEQAAHDTDFRDETPDPEDDAGWLSFERLEGDADLADVTVWHIMRWSPARVLAECAAKRTILRDHVDQGDCFAGDARCPILHSMAAVYADNPDFDPAWTPAP